MTYLFYICLCLFLVVLQTTILPYLPFFRQLYDLLLLFILYLGLYRPVREALPVIILLGFIMDNLSGSPFGLYITVYFWIFVIINWGTQYLHVGNQILLLVVVASGILIENLIFLGTFMFLAKGLRSPVRVLNTTGYQILWGVLTGPVLLMLIRYLHGRFKKWFSARFAEWKEQGG